MWEGEGREDGERGESGEERGGGKGIGAAKGGGQWGLGGGRWECREIIGDIWSIIIVCFPKLPNNSITQTHFGHSMGPWIWFCIDVYYFSVSLGSKNRRFPIRFAVNF